MEYAFPVVFGAVSFVLGQLAQQFIFEPIKAFKTQRADAIYFAVHFIDFVSDRVSWDVEDKRDVKKMRAALIQSMEMIPFYDILSSSKLFGLPSREHVQNAADKIAELAKNVEGSIRKREPTALRLARDIGKLLGAEIRI